MDRRTFPLGAALTLALSCLCAGAQANDTTAMLGAGGLIFVQNDDVAMASEDLSISEKEVRVRYVFRNGSGKDVRSLVAFPLPDVAYYEGDTSIPNPDSDNFLDFRTSVDGKPVETGVERRVIALGLDRTKLLQDLKVPLMPISSATVAALDGLPEEKKRELLELGLVRIDEYDAGKGWERHLAPLNWTLKTTYFWTQTFPAGRDLIVEHRYRPSVGSSVGTLLGMASKDEFIVREQRAMDETFCIDAAFKTAVAKAPRPKGTDIAPFSEARLAYILKTGSNWLGPIADFTLTIDKGAPENLVSFCGTGVKKIGPTTFQMRAKDFEPLRDINILILKPQPKL
ncbi:DUF4424 domain-containing protein [Aquabacter sp. CN5-332]|uniref:DUF4424 domain-containing protein n=1 Tax=Aquabacter sp. CN5-332 TaxID=3156608 RepID=UPI0032B5E6BC